MSEFSDFLEAIAEALNKFAEDVREVFEIVAEKLGKLRDEIFERRAENFDIRTDRKKWREAALLARQRAAARAKAYDKHMQRDKARRALRMRKRLHDDGGVPDW